MKYFTILIFFHKYSFFSHYEMFNTVFNRRFLYYNLAPSFVSFQKQTQKSKLCIFLVVGKLPDFLCAETLKKSSQKILVILVLLFAQDQDINY